ncbi:hypothetical protein TIFTF001_004075 [Ficus carica]|uniref:NAC domain-containing protein n=1 Tax=Ficus carica TaxID=3494 RepID=A0AA87ZI37_FICCA|nr:hypothetical protein TIFTF001_004075 [Ficus carica]
MSQENEPNTTTTDNKSGDDHEHDMVMPGFRFHPTEEELVEFYLRRKVEGKRFNVELITFLDLYRYDPWELPALAAIGEKEWFFYVPRDRKYRNGDRPNRVTTSGYWKATGADRMIRSENFRSIGLKKTLVFYSGKAPKGIRTSWIMNEYRLPQHETERYQKAEISLCRVYKRAGVEDHPSLPRSLPSKASSSRAAAAAAAAADNKRHPHNTMEMLQAFGEQVPPPPHQFEAENTNETDGSSSSDVAAGGGGGVNLGLSKRKAYNRIRTSSITPSTSAAIAQPVASSMDQEEEAAMLSPQAPPKQFCATTLFTGASSAPPNSIDELHRLVNNYQQQAAGATTIISHHHHPQQQYYNQFHPLPMPLPPPQPQQPPLNALPSYLPTAFSDRLWEWNPFPDQANRDQYSNPFK